MSLDDAESSLPVSVTEAIPVGGDHDVSAAEIEREDIPTPAHLRLSGELAHGGIGRIHPATDRHLLRRVALKRLDARLARDPFHRAGFIAEAQVTGQLEHPNIVPVHELGWSARSVPYFTMKFVHGETFDRWLAHPERPVGSTERLRDGLEIFLRVCDAVAYAHHRGVIHRDLKPANVMVAHFGQVYVMDWGLARLTAAQGSPLDAPGAVGTPAYMAPEQARGNTEEMDARSDVFGLGAILYELVTGKRPYGDDTRGDVLLARARAGAVIPVDEAAAGVGVSPRMRAIVERAVAVDPTDRYQSVVELRRDVQAFLHGGWHLPSLVFPPGALLMREGDVGDAAYMIVSGRGRAFRDTPDGRETLALMGPGDVFGEMALLLDEPRAASVEAVDQVTVLVLDRDTMRQGLGMDGWTGALVRALAQRFRALEQQIRSAGIKRGT